MEVKIFGLFGQGFIGKSADLANIFIKIA